MRKYGLIGYPLGHSFSKKYFTEKFHNEHIEDCFYENFPLADINKLKDLIAGEPGLTGLNVTIPYKSDIIRFLNRISSEAEDIGAVNVIKILRTGEKTELLGFNSDVTGIRDSLKPFKINQTKRALVFGTGKSTAGIISYSDIDAALLISTQLIVNTTPLGMYPNMDSCPDIDYRLLNNTHILFDLVYNPEITLFLRKGAEQGATVISGLRMLHSQAEKSWEIWNDDNL